MSSQSSNAVASERHYLSLNVVLAVELAPLMRSCDVLVVVVTMSMEHGSPNAAETFQISFKNSCNWW